MKLFIKNPQNQNVGIQIVHGPETSVTNEGPEGAVIIGVKNTSICLSELPVVRPAEVNMVDGVELNGLFAVQIGNEIIPHYFTPEQLPEFFDANDTNGFGIEFGLSGNTNE